MGKSPRLCNPCSQDDHVAHFVGTDECAYCDCPYRQKESEARRLEELWIYLKEKRKKK